MLRAERSLPEIGLSLKPNRIRQIMLVKIHETFNNLKKPLNMQCYKVSIVPKNTSLL